MRRMSCSYDGCIGVPMHHYSDVTICGPVAPETYATASPSWTDCTSFWWDIDMWGRSSNPNGGRGKYASMEDSCREKATYYADREEMRRRGLSPSKIKVYDFDACCLGELSQQPMCPHSAHLRRCNHHPPRAKHSTQPVPLGSTAGMIPSLSDFIGLCLTSFCFSSALPDHCNIATA
jgi:hypothetical protein